MCDTYPRLETAYVSSISSVASHLTQWTGNIRCCLSQPLLPRKEAVLALAPASAWLVGALGRGKEVRSWEMVRGGGHLWH